MINIEKASTEQKKHSQEWAPLISISINSKLKLNVKDISEIFKNKSQVFSIMTMMKQNNSVMQRFSMLIDKDQWHNHKKSFICQRSWTTIRFQKNPKIWKSSKEQKLSIWEILETIIRKIKIIEKSSCKIKRWENSLIL